MKRRRATPATVLDVHRRLEVLEEALSIQGRTLISLRCHCGLLDDGKPKKAGRGDVLIVVRPPPRELDPHGEELPSFRCRHMPRPPPALFAGRTPKLLTAGEPH